MASIIIQSKEKIEKLDSIEQKSAYAQCRLMSFDMLSYKYQLEYCSLLEREDNEGNLIVIKNVISQSNSYFNPQDIQTLFDITGKDIAQGENFDTEMRDIITTAFIYKVVQDQRFKLTINDWEIVS